MEVSVQSHEPASLLWANDPPVPANNRLGWSESQCARFREVKDHLPLPGFEPKFLIFPARCLVTVLTALPRPPNKA
jgi:hypothetical protein